MVIVKLCLNEECDAEILALLARSPRGSRSPTLVSVLRKGLPAHLVAEGLQVIKGARGVEVVPVESLATVVAPAAPAVSGKKGRRSGVMSWE